MTQNQIRYWDYKRQQLADQEVKRANQERERNLAEQLAETKRANLAREIETSRANFAAESERARANRAQELLSTQGLAIQSGQLQVADYNARSNRAYQQGNLNLGSQTAAITRMQLQETQRANQAREKQNILSTSHENQIKLSSLEETRKHNRATEKTASTSNVFNLLGSLANTLGRYLAIKTK